MTSDSCVPAVAVTARTSRVSEGRERGVERGVGAAVARPGQGDVMGLVDDNEPDAARLRETRGVYGEKLGRGEHAVDTAIG